MSQLAKREGLKVEGFIGKWYVIDEKEIEGNTLYLLEHETYGDETAHIIIDGDLNLVLDDVWNGWLDYEEAFDVEIDY